MIYSPKTPHRSFTRNEQGGSRLSFLITVAIMAFIAYSAYQYIPVWYNAYLLKDKMQQAVDIAAGTGKSPEWTRDQIRAYANEQGLPPDTVINVQRNSNRIEANVRWTRPVNFPGYVYQYEFDHTVKSDLLLSQ